MSAEAGSGSSGSDTRPSMRGDEHAAGTPFPLYHGALTSPASRPHDDDDPEGIFPRHPEIASGRSTLRLTTPDGARVDARKNYLNKRRDSESGASAGSGVSLGSVAAGRRPSVDLADIPPARPPAISTLSTESTPRADMIARAFFPESGEGKDGRCGGGGDDSDYSHHATPTLPYSSGSGDDPSDEEPSQRRKHQDTPRSSSSHYSLISATPDRPRSLQPAPPSSAATAGRLPHPRPGSSSSSDSGAAGASSRPTPGATDSSSRPRSLSNDRAALSAGPPPALHAPRPRGSSLSFSGELSPIVSVGTPHSPSGSSCSDATSSPRPICVRDRRARSNPSHLGFSGHAGLHRHSDSADSIHSAMARLPAQSPGDRDREISRRHSGSSSSSGDSAPDAPERHTDADAGSTAGADASTKAGTGATPAASAQHNASTPAEASDIFAGLVLTDTSRSTSPRRGAFAAGAGSDVVDVHVDLSRVDFDDPWRLHKEDDLTRPMMADHLTKEAKKDTGNAASMISSLLTNRGKEPLAGAAAAAGGEAAGAAVTIGGESVDDDSSGHTGRRLAESAPSPYGARVAALRERSDAQAASGGSGDNRPPEPPRVVRSSSVDSAGSHGAAARDFKKEHATALGRVLRNPKVVFCIAAINAAAFGLIALFASEHSLEEGFLHDADAGGFFLETIHPWLVFVGGASLTMAVTVSTMRFKDDEHELRTMHSVRVITPPRSSCCAWFWPKFNYYISGSIAFLMVLLFNTGAFSNAGVDKIGMSNVAASIIGLLLAIPASVAFWYKTINGIEHNTSLARQATLCQQPSHARQQTHRSSHCCSSQCRPVGVALLFAITQASISFFGTELALKNGRFFDVTVAFWVSVLVAALNASNTLNLAYVSRLGQKIQLDRAGEVYPIWRRLRNASGKEQGKAGLLFLCIALNVYAMSFSTTECLYHLFNRIPLDAWQDPSMVWFKFVCTIPFTLGFLYLNTWYFSCYRTLNELIPTRHLHDHPESDGEAGVELLPRYTDQGAFARAGDTRNEAPHGSESPLGHGGGRPASAGRHTPRHRSPLGRSTTPTAGPCASPPPITMGV